MLTSCVGVLPHAQTSLIYISLAQCEGTSSSAGVVTLAYRAAGEVGSQALDLRCGAEADMVVGVLQSCGVPCAGPAQGDA